MKHYFATDDQFELEPILADIAAKVNPEFIARMFTPEAEAEYLKVTGEGAPQFTFLPKEDEQLCLL
jgi:hypothetical protein